MTTPPPWAWWWYCRTAPAWPRGWLSWRGRWAARASGSSPPAGGQAGDPIGTDAVRVMGAVEAAGAGGAPVLVLMDLGSAVLSATALDLLLDEDLRRRVLLCEAPLVEGAVAAAAAARAGGALEDVAREARAGLAGKAAHLGAPPGVGAPPRSRRRPEPPPAGAASRPVVRAAHGLHARPAAAVVRRRRPQRPRCADIRNLTTGAGLADARSLAGLSTLGALDGHRVLIEARGPEAARALDDIRAMVEEEIEDGARPTPTRRAQQAPPAAVPADAVPPAPGEELRGVAASPGLGSGPAHVLGAVAALPESPASDPPGERAALRGALAAAAASSRASRAAASGNTADIVGSQILLLDDIALTGPAERAIDAGAPGRAGLARRCGALRRGVRAPGRPLPARPRRGCPGRRAGGWSASSPPPAPAAATRQAVPRAASRARRGRGGGARPRARDRHRDGGEQPHRPRRDHRPRALGIPAVTGLGPAVLAVADGATLLVNGDAGTVVVDPTAGRLAAHEARAADARAAAERAAARVHEPARTRDGCHVEVAANIGAPGDLDAAVSGGADGVGLLRTEFLFLGRADAPGEEEQYRVLRGGRGGARRPAPGAAHPRRPARARPGLPAHAGGRTTASSVARGIRLSLEQPGMLTTQLRAALRAAAEPVSVMFPIVGGAPGDRARRGRFSTRPPGPCAPRASRRARSRSGPWWRCPPPPCSRTRSPPRVGFLSIGTNDLVQYTMAAERGNQGVATLSDPPPPGGAAAHRARGRGRRRARLPHRGVRRGRVRPAGGAGARGPRRGRAERRPAAGGRGEGARA